MDYVEFNGKKIYASYAALNLRNLDIDDISQIRGLNSLKSLKSLYLNDNQITELSGLENLSNLEILNLNNNQITEIDGLKNLTKIETLYLSDNQINNIKDLKYLTRLKYLDLHNNTIENLNFLESLINLQTLQLNSNKITELKSLEKLRSLITLNLNYNQLTAIDGLETLLNLQILYISNNKITEIKGLRNLVRLTYLDLSNNQITEIKGLKTFLKLKFLNLQKNKIAKIQGLNSLINLRYLYLGDEEITEIEGFKNLIKLNYLDLSNNSLTEIKELDSLKFLQTLNINGNRIDTIKGLENLTSLQEFSIEKNQIPEELIVKLGGVNQKGKVNEPYKFVEYCYQNKKRKTPKKEILNYVTYKGKNFEFNNDELIIENKFIQKITDIIGLIDLKKLEKLSLANNLIVEIKGLGSLKNLKSLNLENNRLTEINGLENLNNLKELFIGGNEIQEDLITHLGGLDNLGKANEPKKFVEYCRQLRLYVIKKEVSEYVIFKQKKFQLKNNKLNLDGLRIKDITKIKGLGAFTHLESLSLNNNDITEIKGLKTLTHLQSLSLNDNDITEIKGLETLTNLQSLALNNNQLSEIKGLQNLASLKYLNIAENQIPESLILELGGLGRNGLANNVLNFTKYCQQNIFNKLIKSIELDLPYRITSYLRKFRNDFNPDEGWEVFINLMNYWIEQAKTHLFLLLPEYKSFVDVLFNLSEKSFQNEDLHLLINSPQDPDFKTFKLKAEQLVNFSIKETKHPVNLIAVVKDGEEVLLGKVIETENKLMWIASTNKEIMNVINDLILDYDNYVNIVETNKVLMKILNFENENQKNIEKAELIRNLDFNIDEAEYYLNSLRNVIDYNPNEAQTFRTNIRDILIRFEKPTLYDLMKEFMFDFDTAKKIGKYLMDEGWIKSFPNVNIINNGVKPITKLKTEISVIDDVRGILVFISYAMVDSEKYTIKQIVEILNDYEEIEKAVYCEKDTKSDIIRFMEEYIEKCDVLVLFCSPDAKESGYVKDEWMNFRALEKPIIPVYTRREHVPALLTSRLGARFDMFDIKKSAKEIYSIIIKNLKIPLKSQIEKSAILPQ